jgi:uncharacterized membrane protein YkoI
LLTTLALPLFVATPAVSNPNPAMPTAASAATANAGRTLQIVEPVSLIAAVVTAEAKLQGRAIEASFDSDRGGVYEVDVVKNRSVYRVIIDAQDGTVRSSKRNHTETLWSRWVEENRLTSAPQSLASLLRQVEDKVQARVQDVALETTGGRTYFEVEVVGPLGERDLIVDPASGTVMLAPLD